MENIKKSQKIKISDNKIVLTVTTIDEFESLTTNSDPLTLTCET